MRQSLNQAQVPFALASVPWGYICGGLAAVVIAAWLVAAALSVSRNTSRLRRIARERAGESFEQFREHFSDLPLEELRALYEYLQRALAFRGFPLRADDNLAAMFGLSEVDLQDFAAEAVQRAGRVWPSAANFSRSVLMETVGDLVRFVLACPRQQPAPGGGN
jgi:hypothetical protein